MSVRWQLGDSSDCLLGVVPQPTDSRLSGPNHPGPNRPSRWAESVLGRIIRDPIDACSFNRGRHEQHVVLGGLLMKTRY